MTEAQERSAIDLITRLVEAHEGNAEASSVNWHTSGTVQFLWRIDKGWKKTFEGSAPCPV